MTRTDIPPSYRRFRNGWGLAHLALLAVASILLIIWAATNGNGTRLVGAWWTWSTHLQSTLFNLVSFPWE